MIFRCARTDKVIQQRLSRNRRLSGRTCSPTWLSQVHVLRNRMVSGGDCALFRAARAVHVNGRCSVPDAPVTSSSKNLHVQLRQGVETTSVRRYCFSNDAPVQRRSDKPDELRQSIDHVHHLTDGVESTPEALCSSNISSTISRRASVHQQRAIAPAPARCFTLPASSSPLPATRQRQR